MSKSTVSRITQKLNGDFETWRQRDLSDLNVVYLFLGGEYHAARQGTDEKEGVLSAYAILEDWRPVLLHLDLKPRESYDAWLSFLQDMVARGLQDPLVIFDGAAGLHKAVKRMWPRAFRQRCQVHKMRNILAKLPRVMQGQMKRLIQQVFPRIEPCAGTQARACVDRAVSRPLFGGDEVFGARPGGMCHVSAFSIGASSSYSNHQSAGAAQRRGTPANQGDSSVSHRTFCLALLFASLVTASWRGVKMTPAAIKQLQRLRRETVITAGQKAVA